jgi:hypothetical protein
MDCREFPEEDPGDAAIIVGRIAGGHCAIVKA